MLMNAMPSAPLLSVTHACITLGRQTFGPFNFTVSAGQRLAIIGPSGAGKSTLLSALSGEKHHTRGSIHLREHSLANWSLSQLSLIRAVLPQQHEIAFSLENHLIIRLGRIARRSDPYLNNIVMQAAKLAEADHLLERRFDTLSGGEKARVHLARVFAQLWDVEQGLLLVDEPLSALDPGLQLSLMSRIQTFVAERQHALIAILHDINQAMQDFDQVLMIKHGQQVGLHATDQLLIPHLESLYGIKFCSAYNENDQVFLMPTAQQLAEVLIA